ncbi:MAG: hypothetical protein HW421_3880 [Ignavibacteria bacterium]|nr:hypothetical protein [Ignavibacteria bacterium]
MRIQFTNIKLLNMGGNTRDDFNGKYNADELSDFLIEKWIPYFECNKCGKSDYCKYTVPSKVKFKKQDIKCGVAKDALRNYLNYTFHLITDADLKQKQNYIDSAYYFYKFVISTEQNNGSFIWKDHLDWWNNYAPRLFGYTVELRNILNNLAKCMKVFPQMFSGSNFLLVEGESEKDFIETLNEFSYIIVETYKGKGNKKLNRTQMLIENYVNNGYIVYLQCDADGKEGRMYQSYIDAKLIQEDNCFQFTFDFETSIPSKLLYYCLVQLEFLSNVTIEDFIQKTEIRKESIAKILKNEFGIEIESKKRDLAKKLGELINTLISENK